MSKLLLVGEEAVAGCWDFFAGWWDIIAGWWDTITGWWDTNQGHQPGDTSQGTTKVKKHVSTVFFFQENGIVCKPLPAQVTAE